MPCRQTAGRTVHHLLGVSVFVKVGGLSAALLCTGRPAARGVLLANYGPASGGGDLEQAVDAIVELEQTAKLYMALRGLPVRPLSSTQVEQLQARFPSPPAGSTAGTK